MNRRQAMITAFATALTAVCPSTTPSWTVGTLRYRLPNGTEYRLCFKPGTEKSSFWLYDEKLPSGWRWF